MTDRLSEATRALRELDPSPERAELTRARIMRSLHGERQQRGRKLAFGIPLAAILLGSTAWAASAGTLPRAWSVVREIVSEVRGARTPEPPAPELPVKKRIARALAPQLESPGDGLPPESSGAADDENAAETLAPAAPPSVSEAARAASPAPAPRPSPARDPSLELYRAAHRLHFEGGEPAAALAAWDAYLRAAPRGALAPEARYNRALALVRLGRKPEAIAALEPFAHGRHGGYRQVDARRLMEALVER